MKPIAALLMLVVLASGVYSYVDSDASPVEQTSVRSRPKKTLSSFKSETELRAFFQKLKKKAGSTGYGAGNASGAGVGDLSASYSQVVTVAAAAAPMATESVTNIQHAGVDEGGIVKLRGEYLIILRRGRLFTVSIKDGGMKPISSIDAFDPDIDPANSWYDEMLVSDDTIAVIGYSYDRGGTEIAIFNIDNEGHLKYRSTYQLRSNDYYSSRNYASRLIGRKLIFYSPLGVSFDSEKVSDILPAIRKWRKGVKDEAFDRIVPATRIYRGQQQISEEGLHDLALHTVTLCDISDGEMSCKATTVIGPSGNVFYVSPGSIYVWASSWNDDARPILYYMPLDGSAPSALQVSGSPVDQFSFLESDDRNLNVLVRSEAKGDGMWAAETAEGDVALMRIPLTSFSDGATAVPQSQYQSLPKPDGDTFQNRFVGDYILYGTGNGWGAPDQRTSGILYATNWKSAKGGIITLPLAHGVDRIEPLGSHSMVIGTDGKDLHFTSIRLQAAPSVAGKYIFENASQGELRSHGFFYKPADQNSGILGLPVRTPGRPGYEHLFHDSASILFLHNRSLQMTPLGELRSDATTAADDGCRASCVDWYGNARPLFVGGRIFALLGYELVEGSRSGGSISELRRTNFAPAKKSAAVQE